ncbi:MAG TPA: DUF6492 family protein, partial [Polyangiaceae bacterium]|nr:DUF6492 family protein [Polyangiaceae bacterium]
MPAPAPAPRPRFAVFCKSFRRDVSRCVRLVESMHKYAQGPLPLVLSVPEADLPLFRSSLPRDGVELFADEAVVGGPLKQSWRTQQVVKMEAWRLDFADAWLIVDSDGAFVRPFSVDDFVDAEGRVAFVASRILHLFDRHERELLAYMRDGRGLDLPSAEQLLALRGGRAPLAIPR